LAARTSRTFPSTPRIAARNLFDAGVGTDNLVHKEKLKMGAWQWYQGRLNCDSVRGLSLTAALANRIQLGSAFPT
jgi:hypothetical protein